MPDIKYQRPEPNYITKTSTSHANRFQGEAQDQNPLKASDLDREFNALIDNDNDISERMAEIAAGLFPGSNAPENKDKIVYCDGTEAKWKKLTKENISDNAIVSKAIADNAVIRGKVDIGAIGTNNLIDRNVTNAKLGDASVNTRTLADSSVTTAKIQNGAVTTEKILDHSVTTSKFAYESFDTQYLKDKSLTPRKTNNCFLLGELKFSVIEPGNLSYMALQEGWIPISLKRQDAGSALNLIPADCFPELRKRIRDYEHILSGTTRYISLKTYPNDTASNRFFYFDFSALVGAYPMLIGATFSLKNEYELLRNSKNGDFMPSDAQLYEAEDKELKTGNFTTWNIPQNALRDYVNGTITTANANYDFTGYQQHQTSRRFGEETIKIGLDNMPAHTHNYTKTTKAASTVAIGNNHNHEQYYFNVTESILGTTSTGGGKELPHLPPSIGLYGYIYGGDYDPDGWPVGLRYQSQFPNSGA